MWNIRWRWNVTRALALLRHSGGKRVPMNIQRMRAEDLLAAVFPAQAACADNHNGPIEPPQHPLVDETIANCLYETMDTNGLRAVLEKIGRGEIHTVAVETPAPSVMAHEILNANPYAFLDDAPLEERRARAVALRRTDPELAAGMGALDPDAIATVRAQAWPDVRDADELHDVLLSLVLLPAQAIGDWQPLSDELVIRGRAAYGEWQHEGAAHRALIAAERIAVARAVLPALVLAPTLVPPAGAPQACDDETAGVMIIRGWLECLGPTSVADLGARLGLGASTIAAALARLEGEGIAMQGRFTAEEKRPGASPAGSAGGASIAAEVEWCERRLLARIHHLTLGRLRREIEPVSAADLMRFLFRWQHVQPGTHLHGRQGVLEIVSQLQGVELPARAWEAHVLPARIARYDPNDLEQLCLAGAVAWGRLRAGAPADEDEEQAGPRRARTPNRAAPLAFVLREDLPWLIEPQTAPPDVGGDAELVLEHLRTRGASFVSDVARATHLLPAAVEEALWTLVASGLVTGDGTAGLRALIEKPEESRRTRRLHMLRGGRGRLVPAGRWALLRDTVEEASHDVERFARQWLRRYGIVMRELLAREPRMPPWRDLVRVLRTLEARGEVRGGRFVAGMVGEQFALPEAVEALRAVRRKAGAEEIVVVAAGDPLNLSGILVPGPRIAPASRDVIAFKDGAVIETGELGAVRSRLGQRTARA